MKLRGKRDGAILVKGIGGKAFPKDFNWICPVCSGENRSFEKECGYCIHKAFYEREVK